MKDLILKLAQERQLNQEEYLLLLDHLEPEDREFLHEQARVCSQKHFGNGVYIRGLIEFSNYCKNNCYYCGIRQGNKKIQRYRLTKEEILSCCQEGYQLGFRTFVLQGGEDPYYTAPIFTDIIAAIREGFPDCAITLSIGERSRGEYEQYYRAGADRFLLRQETSDPDHYRFLHPEPMTLENRHQCLFTLKEIGFQTGGGFMVGSPSQTNQDLVKDLLFLKELNPAMVGIGPFLPHASTPFGSEPQGSFEKTLVLLSILRLMLPAVLLPATTALGTIHPKGREMGILAGANVVMPNLSPIGVRKKYELYNNKICTGDEAAECIRCLGRRLQGINYQIAVGRGDHASVSKEEIQHV